MASLDTNAWYQIVESRVDFNSSLQVSGQGLFFAAQCGTCNSQKWQIQPISNGQYQLRNSALGSGKQLTVCYAKTETDASKTQPCMLPASGDDTQKWQIDSWGDGTYKFINAANGSNYNLDCHPGNPLFMSSQTAATPKQPAQHWMFSSIGAIEDGTYSTTVLTTTQATSVDAKSTATAITLSAGTQTITPGATPTAASSSSSKSSLSTGAAAGVGLGVGLFVISLALLAFLAWNKRRKNQALRGEQYGNMASNSTWQESRTSPHSINAKFASGNPVSELPNEPLAHEMATPPVELPGAPQDAATKSPGMQHFEPHR